MTGQREDLLDEAATRERVRALVAANAGLGSAAADLADDQDLWEAGMDSLASVRVMIAVEEELDFEFPEEMLTRETFGSVAALAAAVLAVLRGVPGAAGGDER